MYHMQWSKLSLFYFKCQAVLENRRVQNEIKKYILVAWKLPCKRSCYCTNPKSIWIKTIHLWGCASESKILKWNTKDYDKCP